MEHTQMTRVIRRHASKSGHIRTCDLVKAGIPRIALTRMVRSGEIERIARGVYVLPGGKVTENHSLAEIAGRVPEGVVCLLSALRFHGITTQNPSEVYLMIPSGTRTPREGRTRFRVFRAGGASLREGIIETRIEGVNVRISDVAKTVADCFKYRNKIGLDVAMEALTECRRRRLCPMDDLWRFAKICRVANVMRPYLEMAG
jgi:predicted transcriptional regulator of viral defense system